MPPRRKKEVVVSSDPDFKPPPLKVTTGGNSIADQEWIGEMLADGSLRDITTEDYDGPQPPDGFLYDVIYRWEADAEEANAEYFLQFLHPNAQEKRRCNGTAYVRDQRGGYVVDRDWIRITRPCLRPPGRGADVCQAHGALVPLVKEAAQRRLAEAAEIVAMRLLGLTGPFDELNTPIEHGDRIKAANSVLDRAGIKGDIKVEVSAPGYKRVLEHMFSAEDESDDG